MEITDACCLDCARGRDDEKTSSTSPSWTTDLVVSLRCSSRESRPIKGDDRADEWTELADGGEEDVGVREMSVADADTGVGDSSLTPLQEIR